MRTNCSAPMPMPMPMPRQDPGVVIRFAWLPPAALSLMLNAAPSLAADLTVSIELPRLNVVEYHRPYVAMWIERKDQSFAGNLAVWYDVRKRDNEGTKWLKDLRSWWRRSGRTLQMPIDGLSGATRSPGKHQLTFNDQHAALSSLAPGDYRVVIEAAREVGGREIVSLPFAWPPRQNQSQAAHGDTELGDLTLEASP